MEMYCDLGINKLKIIIWFIWFGLMLEIRFEFNICVCVCIRLLMGDIKLWLDFMCNFEILIFELKIIFGIGKGFCGSRGFIGCCIIFKCFMCWFDWSFLCWIKFLFKWFFIINLIFNLI